MPQERASVGEPSSFPFGIGRHHLSPQWPRLMRHLLVFTFIGLPLLAAMVGLLGGGSEPVKVARSPEATLTVVSPSILRSGNWFETAIVVEAHDDIADVAIAIDQPLWRGMSIDTEIPDPVKLESLEREFTYSFGPLARGERLLFKLDGQIQPRGPRRMSGRITVRDAGRALAAVPMTLTVLP
jgi:hypothetical protein